MSGPDTRRAAAFRHPDSGLQPERTSLAWGRTLLALMVTGCFFLRWMQIHGWVGGRLALVCVLLGGFVWLMQWLRYRDGAAGICNNCLAPAAGSVLLVGMGIGAMSLTALWVILMTD